jgi:hypothetical protein
MPIYKIMRIYEVPGKDQVEATDSMMQALTLHVESDYHLTDFVKSPDDPKGKGQRISLKPAKGWGATFLEQVFGRYEK